MGVSQKKKIVTYLIRVNKGKGKLSEYWNPFQFVDFFLLRDLRWKYQIQQDMYDLFRLLYFISWKYEHVKWR